jgi:hypothetical protein
LQGGVLKGGAPSILCTEPALVTARYLAVESSGAMWTTNDNYIARYAPDGRSVTHVIGNGKSGYTAAGSDGSLARFDNPNGIAIRRDGTIYVADTGNRVIRKLTPVRIASMVAVTVPPASGQPRGLSLASVRVTGADGLPVGGFPVSYVIDDGKQTHSYSADTDIDGILQVRLRMQFARMITFTIDGLPPVILPLTRWTASSAL